MFRYLLRKEILSHLLSFRFAVLAPLGFVFIAWSMFDGAAYYLDRVSDHDVARGAMRERIQQIVTADDRIAPGTNNWREIFDIGFRISIPSNALAVFERGLDPIHGRSMQIDFGSRSDGWLTRSPVAEEPILDIAPELDFGTVVRVVFGLFALLLSFDAVCGERENGTLRLVVSFPISRMTILFSKVLGATVSIVTAFAIPTLLGFALLNLHPDIQVSTQQWYRLWLISASYVAFICTMSCSGVLISCLTQSARTSLIMLLVIWVLWTILIPRIGPTVADKFSKAPSVTELETDVRQMRQQTGATYEARLQEWKAEYIKKNGTAPENSKEGETEYYELRRAAHRLQRVERDEAERQMRQDFRNRQDAWVQMGKAIARLSPAFSLRSAALTMAGTGVDRFRRVREAALSYLRLEQRWNHETWYEYIFEDFQNWGKPREQWKVDSPPSFQYHESWTDDDIVEALPDAALVCLWGALFFAAAGLSVARYDCR